MLLVKSAYFLRHGETEYNRKGLFSGKTDIPLNQTGILQAKNASHVLSNCQIQEIWSSPLYRARQTAAIVADYLDIDVKVLNELTERNYGDWEGKAKSGINRLHSPPQGETEFSLSQRAECVINQILDERTLEPIVLVSHSGVFRAIRKLIYSNANPCFPSHAENGMPIRMSIPVNLCKQFTYVE